MSDVRCNIGDAGVPDDDQWFASGPKGWAGEMRGEDWVTVVLERRHNQRAAQRLIDGMAEAEVADIPHLAADLSA